VLNFTELSSDGQDLELLARELLFRRGFSVHWSGKGADGGRDLICVEYRDSFLLPDSKRWLVQCKHNAVSGKSVGIGDLDSIVDSCKQHSCTAYLLVCSTYPSSAVVQRLEAIAQAPGSIQTTFWDAVRIERLLSTPSNWSLAQRFFPKSAGALGWNVYATTSPNRWVVNHRGYYFHLSNRIGSSHDYHFESIDKRLDEIETIKLPEDHFIRVRSIWFDDKNGAYSWNLDYMAPSSNQPNETILQTIERALGSGYALEDGQIYDFTLKRRAYSKHSDHYDPDHYDYYENLPLNSYLRFEGDARYDTDASEANKLRELALKREAYDRFVHLLAKLSFIKIIRASNAQFEDLDQFFIRKNWAELLEDFGDDHFLSVFVILATTDHEKFHRLVSFFPQDIEFGFRLLRVEVYLPSEGGGSVRDTDDNPLYEIKFSTWTFDITDKAAGRAQLNDYLEKVIDGIKGYISLHGSE